MSDLAFAIVIAVASFAEAWIEMCPIRSARRAILVASFAEAWIEIAYPSLSAAPAIVASFAEAWIEIKRNYCSCFCFLVASFAEAWIEILNASPGAFFSMSPPSRRRGLKLYDSSISRNTLRRLLRGGVD